MGVGQLPKDLPTRYVSIFFGMLISNHLPGGTASGNEAILECSPGSYCCDANRPEIGCCQTSKDFFPLPDGTVVASIGANGPEQPPAAGSSLTAAASSESGGKIITTAERDLVAQNSITQSGSKENQPPNRPNII